MQASSIQNTANPRSDGDLQSSVQKRATQEGPRRAHSLSEGVIKSGGRLFATESSGGHKALLLYGGRAWLLQNLQLSPRKELCNLHGEVCADRRGRGQREAAALRRGQSKLLSRKKKKKAKPKHPTPQSAPLLSAPTRLWPCTPAPCLPPAESAGQSRPDPSRRTANGTPGSAKVQKCERGAQSVKFPCLLEGGGTLTYIYPMGDGSGGGTVTHFGPMRQTGGGSTWLCACCLPGRVGNWVGGEKRCLKEPHIQETLSGTRKPKTRLVGFRKRQMVS